MDDDDSMEMIVCRKCERPTCEPPDELMEFKGLCPGCVIRQEVLPTIPHRFAELIESILDNRDDAIMEQMIAKITSGRTGGVVVVDVTGGSEDMADKVFEVFKHIILHDKDARAKLKDIIEHIDTCPNHEGHEHLGGKVKKPVVRNDPRTS